MVARSSAASASIRAAPVSRGLVEGPGEVAQGVAGGLGRRAGGGGEVDGAPALRCEHGHDVEGAEHGSGQQPAGPGKVELRRCQLAVERRVGEGAHAEPGFCARRRPSAERQINGGDPHEHRRRDQPEGGGIARDPRHAAACRQ